jgi:hypothetical protein
LNASLKAEHYGNPNPITNKKGGVIDTRAAVGLLSRNIQILKGPDANGWGCRVQIYSYLQSVVNQTTGKVTLVPINGYAILDGVEINGCGQYDTFNAGLRI